MKKTLGRLALIACVVLGVGSMLFANGSNESSSTEGSKELTIYFSPTIDQMTPVLDAFKAKYPDIEVKTYRGVSEEMAATMDLEVKSGNPQFDVVFMSNGPVINLQDKYQCFQKFTPEGQENFQKELLDPEGELMPIGTGFYTIIYNKNLVSEADKPTSFKDLTNPKWNHAVVMADPTSSSSVYTFIWMITQYLDQAEYGWDYFKKLQALDVSYVSSHGTLGETVAIGERKIGVQVMATAGSSLKKGDPIGIVYPKEGLPSEVNVLAIRKETPNDEAAKLFANFIASKEGQILVGENCGWVPVRTDLDEYTLADGTKLSDVTMLARDVKWVNNEKPMVLEKFGEIRAK